MKTLEEITYDAGRHALAQQHTLVELWAQNAVKVRWMSGLSALLSLLVVVQALAWIVGLVG